MQKLKRFILLAEDLSHAKPLRVTLWLILLNTVVMVACVLLGISSQYNEPGRYFREGRLMTWISTFQLIAVGYICQQVWNIMRKSEKFSWKDPSAVWKIVSISFYFFAFDELCRFHEATDRYFHKLIGWNPSGITDHIDDAIICLYGVFGIFCLIHYRRQIPLFIGSIGFFIGAFIMAVFSIFFDFTSGDRETLNKYLHSNAEVEWYMTWFGLIEEFFKIYAEAFFIGAALYCFLRALKITAERVDAYTPANEIS